ncbi:MAG: 5'-methylthioadenosine/adenosylhomocysteine nucleosidase [Lachnospiraceae bacterium]|nr:5'-methylthioadenosine/adenosylhomocysteine nucleosidase [Lachnospiraceae bacterium]
MLGIIGAMDEEVAKIKDQMENVKAMSKASMEFFEGTLNGSPVVVVRSGIGKVNAAMCTQILADEYHVDAIINTGIAGSLNADIDIGDVVLSTDTLEHDMDAVAFGYPLGQIPRMDTLSFESDARLREMARQACEQVNPDIKVFEGRIVSGDQFISDKNKKNWLVENFEGCCTEMEGAAIAHAAYLNQIPFLIIRAISDKADDSASVDYPAFEAKAIEHSVKLLLELCKRL